jgi:DNA repair protein RadC
MNYYNHYSLAKEEMAFYGHELTSLQNLLAILIGPTANSSVTGQLAAMGIKRLSSLSVNDLMAYGIGESAAERIIAAFGIAFAAMQQGRECTIIRVPEDAVKFFSYLALLDQEHFDTVFLNTKNEVLGKKNIFKGSLDACVAHPREIFKEAFRMSAASIICAHNHPSGHPHPSKEDIIVGKRLHEVGRLMGVELLDFIIIGHNGRYFSFKEKEIFERRM